MQTDHWGDLPMDEESGALTPDKYVPTSVKKLKLDEIQRAAQLPYERSFKIQLKSSLITQTIEVMKQTEVLQSLIDTYSNKNGTSNYLLNPCQMIPEVDFPPENAADLVGEQKFQKPIWFIPSVDTAYSRGEPQSYPEVSSNVCRFALYKVMCGLLRLAGFTDCSESAIMLLTDAAEEFLRSFTSVYRGFYDVDLKLQASTVLHLLPLEQAYTALTGTSLTQVHNYYKHKVIARNRAEIAEFNSVLQDYDKLMKESQSSMQKHQEFNGNGNDFLNILEMQPSDDGSRSGVGNGGGIGHIVGDMLKDLGGSNATMTMGNMVGQQQMLGSSTLYGLLDGQNQVSTTPSLQGTSGYQANFE
ncbi:uncharacterized protein LOC115629859 [Scaptodrosophila lebanonensis]|uniref:Uncharacterized protein LOC115629859 n=1 Tax=Drosophila lebanonensis TaxID=7225 RepID=A0A6J2U0U6_DROLE|nr:uncharacterized protein LOC115629859 [Scaptodrosophila lebanonensis]